MKDSLLHKKTHRGEKKISIGKKERKLYLKHSFSRTFIFSVNLSVSLARATSFVMPGVRICPCTALAKDMTKKRSHGLNARKTNTAYVAYVLQKIEIT
jgi:hypothetical protein